MPLPVMASNASATPQPPLEVGTMFVGYEVRGLIGQGGHACVFHGYDSFMGQHVAIKVLYRPGGVSQEMMKRGQAEAQLLNRLLHTNIVKVIRAGIEDGLLYIVMELLRGRSLRTILEQEGRLEVEEVLFLAAQIADAAAAAHDQKAIHRDLKPDNVFVTAENHVKVLDFGIAKLVDHAAWTTQKNIVLGTMLYMSPEQVQGLTLTSRSDIYALGLIMYTALFGRHPCLIGLQNATFAELTRIQVTRNAPALDELDPRIPPHVARLVGRAITKLPEERPATMRQFAAEIRQSLERHVAETRQRNKVLQTRDLSQNDDKSASGWRVAALGPNGTAPLAQDVPRAPVPVPPTITVPAHRQQLAPQAYDASRYGTPGSRRGPSSADKATLLAAPDSLKRAATPSPAPPVARRVPAQPPQLSSAPTSTLPRATGSRAGGVTARLSPLSKAAIAGIALGAIIGVGGGWLLTLDQPAPLASTPGTSALVAAMPPRVDATEIGLDASASEVAGTDAAAPSAEGESAVTPSGEAAPLGAPSPPKAAPLVATGPRSVSTAINKPHAAAAADKMQQRLQWLEEDLKNKPAASSQSPLATKAPSKSVPKSAKEPLAVGSGLAF